MIKIFLVEDELGAIQVFKSLLAFQDDNFEICGVARNVKDALTMLKEDKPDLLILDVTLPDGTGFDILEVIGEVDFEIIFVTAHEEHALKAIKNNAFDYMLKPLHSKEMHTTLQRVKEKIEIKNHKEPKKLAIHAIEGIQFIDQESILYLKAESNYTNIHLKDGGVLVASKTLGNFEDKLSADFLRIHQSYITNTQLVQKFIKSDSTVILENGKELPVSRTRREKLLDVLL